MDGRIRGVLKGMKGSLDNNIKVGDMAVIAGLSVWYFGHLFKEQVGRSPASYLKSLRMKAAKQLLETTSLSVKVIRVKVGFQGDSHFVRDFELIYGYSPERFRQRAAVRSLRRSVTKAITESANR
jgi:two-component system, response regulator YesN